MQGYLTLSSLFDKLFTSNLVDKIYHDVTILNKDGKRFPVYKVGTEFEYIGPDDSKIMMCYLRQIGNMQAKETVQLSGCKKMYFVRIPYRLVFYNDYETRNFDQLQAALMNIIFVPKIDFVQLIIDEDFLKRVEGLPANIVLSDKSFYMAIDIEVTAELNAVNCEQQIDCSDLDNPLCKI